MEIKDQPANRSGIKTTEFWLVLAVNIMAPLMAYLEKIDGTWGILVSAFTAGVYAVLRSAVKNNLLNKTQNKNETP